MNNYVQIPFIMNVNGFCGSGKSFMIQYLIKSLKSQLDCVMVFSNTAAFTDDYEFLKSLGIAHYVFSSLDSDEKLKKIMIIQKKNRLQDKPRNVLIIFDDVFGSIKDSKVFKDIVTTFRHYRISIIFSTQYITAASTYLREISNYIVIFNQRSKNSLLITYENYFITDFEHFGDFKAAFKNTLQPYHFYFIDRIKNSKSIMVCPAKL